MFSFYAWYKPSRTLVSLCNRFWFRPTQRPSAYHFLHLPSSWKSFYFSMKNCFYIFFKEKERQILSIFDKKILFDFYQKACLAGMEFSADICFKSSLTMPALPVTALLLSSVSGWCKCCFFSTILFSLWMPLFWLLSVDYYLFILCGDYSSSWIGGLESAIKFTKHSFSTFKLICKAGARIIFTNLIMHLFRILLVLWDSS